MEITLLTGNQNKIREAEAILNKKIEYYDMDLEEIQSINPREVVEHKVMQAYRVLKKPVFVWDVSLEFEALNSFPGPLIKFYWQTIGLDKLCIIAHNLNNDKLIARTTLGLYNGKEMKFFEGVTKGRVPLKPRGKKGWAWDKIFIPEGEKRTFGEMSLEEKNKFSMHRKALKQLKEFLGH